MVNLSICSTGKSSRRSIFTRKLRKLLKIARVIPDRMIGEITFVFQVIEEFGEG
jgi:hypothetical protein